jgi:hypothetical protein
VLLKHPWAPPVFETRAAASPQILRYYDGLVHVRKGHHGSHVTVTAG